MSINAHLRDFHGYSLADSVKWNPSEMQRIHELEHAEADCGHDHDQEGPWGTSS